MAKNEKTYKNTKKKVIVTCVLIIVISFISVFARYVLNRYNDFYTRTKEFYFYSDKLGEDMPIYQLENWGGTSNYSILINMSSSENSLLSATYDIEYDISYRCSDNVICQFSKQTGVIYSTTNTDSFTLTITPNTTLKTGDSVYVEITAVAQDPYEKTLSARFNLIVGQESISYEIIDSPHSPYLELGITNTLSYYTVAQAFDTYNINDRITRDAYRELPDIDKEKCYSALIGASFNPNILVLDMTNENYLHAVNTTTTLKNSYVYINSLTFKVDAITSTRVRFYKMDPTQDYSYPNGNNSSPIITVTGI